MSQKQSPKKGKGSPVKMAEKVQEEEKVVQTPVEKKEVSEEETKPEKPEGAEGSQHSEEEEEEEIFENLGAAVAGFSSWFTSTISAATSTAKEKSSEMFNYLKQDLSEFSETVSEASKDLKDKLKLDDVARSAVTNMTSTATVVLDQMSTIFGVGPDDDDEELVMDGPSPVIDRIKSKIYSLAFEENLFLNDPEDLKAYEIWMLTFDLEKKSGEMRDLMSANPHLQLHYGQLVPDKVSHLVFWHRFYYRVHEICVEEEEKEKIRRVTEAKNADQEETGDQSDDDKGKHSPTGSDKSLVDISEEDQKRLLAEYEEEMKNSSAQHSRRSSGTHLSSSSSGSFAMVTHDANTDEIKCD